MNFLNVGPWELVAILVIAILLVGPKRMLEVARTIGRVTAQMRQMSGEFLGTVQAELDATEAEARQALEGVVEGGREPVAELQAAEQETRQAIEGMEEDRRRTTTSIRAELEALQRETGDAVKDIRQGVERIVTGEPAQEKAPEDEKAIDQ